MTKRDKWNELLAMGGADMFFTSYPGDEELAATLNGALVGDKPLSVEELRADRERYFALPRRGEIREEKVASPTKHVIRNKAQQLNLEEAIAEILDNIFDNFEREPRGTAPPKLVVELVFYGPLSGSAMPGELVIRENSGGIPNERVVPLIQLGFSDRAPGGIGAWGEGFKVAVFALGEEVEVFSHYKGEKPVSIYFPRGWLDPSEPIRWREWKVNTHEVATNPPQEGSTLIRIRHLHPEILEKLGLSEDSANSPHACAQQLAAVFGEIYSEKFHNLSKLGCEIRLSITVADSTAIVSFAAPVEERLRSNLAFLPWLRPIRWDRNFTVTIPGETRTANLRVTVYAGLSATDSYSPRYSKSLSVPGVEMWGNGRLFSLSGRIDDESVGWGLAFGGRAGRNPVSNTNTRRIMVIALFSSSDSRDIPWAAPVKNDYNRRSEFYAELRETFARAIRLYKDAPTILEFVLLPFSRSWGELSIADKLQILFKDTDATKEELDSFFLSRFGMKLLNYSSRGAFRNLNADIDQPTVHTVFDIEPTLVRTMSAAAVASKHSFAQRLDLLRAIFPSLSSQAVIEQELGLSLEEVLE